MLPDFRHKLVIIIISVAAFHGLYVSHVFLIITINEIGPSVGKVLPHKFPRRPVVFPDKPLGHPLVPAGHKNQRRVNLMRLLPLLAKLPALTRISSEFVLVARRHSPVQAAAANVVRRMRCQGYRYFLLVPRRVPAVILRISVYPLPVIGLGRSICPRP